MQRNDALLSGRITKKKFAITLVLGWFMSALLLIAWSSNAEYSGEAVDLLVEYPITSGSDPLNIVVESPGRVWFTMPGVNAIGSLVVTSTHTFNKYDVPSPNSEPYDLAHDGSSIWFTEKSGNRIGRFDLSNPDNITEYAIPTPDSAPTGIDVAPNGTVWFVEQDGNKVGKVNPINGAIDDYLYETPGAQFEDIAVANNDNIWMTAPGLNQVVKFVPSTGKFSFVPVVDFGFPSFAPHSIAVDDAGFAWITAPEPDLIGRHLPGTLALWRWYALPTPGGHPTGIAITNFNELNQIWYVNSASGKVGRLTVNINGNVVLIGEVLLSSTNSAPQGIAVDSNGSAWITENGSNMIAEWRPPYFNFNYLPVILS